MSVTDSVAQLVEHPDLIGRTIKFESLRDHSSFSVTTNFPTLLLLKKIFSKKFCETE